MAKVLHHGATYKEWPFEGWYGKCVRCGCEFRLQEGDEPSFAGVPMDEDVVFLPYQTKGKGVLQATMPCPECHIPFAPVSPVPFDD